jgi:hypothetical protein
MAYIPLPPHMEEALVKLIKSMYAEYNPTMIQFSCSKKNPYEGTGSFYSETYQHTFVWEHDKRPYIVRGPGD